jgi:tRNA(Arg) A34 adenosine deaminase TadA
MDSRPTSPDPQLQLWMERLLRRAAAAGDDGEIPVAAVVLDAQGRCVGWGSNRRHNHQQQEQQQQHLMSPTLTLHESR